jgi:hypothetical protein
MEPRQHEQAPNAERLPIQPAGGEYLLLGHEQGQEQRQETVHEVGQMQAEVAQAAMPALPAPVVPVAASPQSQTTDDSSSLIASDDDLIEKEWVDRAKSIIAATKDDPYKREQEISKLQIEYIRKRYGRTIGSAGD